MGKRRNGHISERQLRMLELRYQGMTLSEIGARFGITGEGVRVNVNVGARLIRKHGLGALPDGCTTPFTAEQLASVRPTRNLGPRRTILADNPSEPTSKSFAQGAPVHKPSLDSTIQTAKTRRSEPAGQTHTNTKTYETGGNER